MAFIYRNHQGLSYGDGHLQGPGSMGQVVRLVGHDLFSVNTDPTVPSFGILAKNYKDGEMPGIFCNGGIYETDLFEGTIQAGDALKASATGMLTNGVQAGEETLGRAIAVAGGILKFRLFI